MRKLFLLSAVIFMMLGVQGNASSEKASLPSFEVKLNGELSKNQNRQFPLLVYKDITYVPMTYYDCRFLGLTTDWDNETKTLSINKEYITCAYRDYNWQWENLKFNQVSVCDFNIVVNGKEIDNSKEEYPLLLFRDVTYFPLTWRFAVEEFGWGYDFSEESGLVINSDNYHTESVKLSYCTGAVATDNIYYYYNGISGEKNVVYRVEVDNTSNPQIIHELPDTGMSRQASFVESDGDIYMKYYAGSSPIMSTEYFYKIEKDGTLTKQNPGNYSGGKHGQSESTIEKDGIKVRFYHEYFDAPSKITYTVNGTEYEAEARPGRVQLGRKRNGLKEDNAARHDFIQIYNGKVYYTAVDLETGADSSLYCLDTATGKTDKLLDGVWGFHVYKGWLNEENSDSTMIIYDNNGNLMRYEELTGNKKVIEECDDENIVLQAASGEYQICVVQKDIYGKRTIVRLYDCYASGVGSINGTPIIDTKTGTYVNKFSNGVAVSVSGESPEDSIRLLVNNGKDSVNLFKTSDGVKNIFIYDNMLLYMTYDDIIVKVNLK